MNDDGPLRGIRVIDISTVYAAPITAMLLGDFGADVIKVEHPVGDPARSHGANKAGHGLWWKVISRNKRCMTLKLSTPEGQQILRDLVADADVLVENLRPGVLEKWGLGPEQLHAVNPGLVDVAGHRLWPGRTVRGATCLRYAGRGDERFRASNRPRRTSAPRRSRRSVSPTEWRGSPERSPS